MDSAVPVCPSGAAAREPLARAWLKVQDRSEEHTSELQSRLHLVCRLLLEKKKQHELRDRLDEPRLRAEQVAKGVADHGDAGRARPPAGYKTPPRSAFAYKASLGVEALRLL